MTDYTRLLTKARDLSICLKCNRAARENYVDVNCYTHSKLIGTVVSYNEDFLAGNQMPGCDKLLEHGISVNIDKTSGGGGDD